MLLVYSSNISTCYEIAFLDDFTPSQRTTYADIDRDQLFYCPIPNLKLIHYNC